MERYLSFLFLFFSLYVNAQEKVHKKALNDLTPFIGIWVASDGNMRYEITFEKGIDNLEQNKTIYTFDVVFGSVKWFKDGKLIRETTIKGTKSILNGFITDNPLLLQLLYSDKEKKIRGYGTFKIDNVTNPQKAEWKHSPTGIGENREKTDFPRSLEFSKVQ